MGFRFGEISFILLLAVLESALWIPLILVTRARPINTIDPPVAPLAGSRRGGCANRAAARQPRHEVSMSFSTWVCC